MVNQNYGGFTESLTHYSNYTFAWVLLALNYLQVAIYLILALILVLKLAHG